MIRPPRPCQLVPPRVDLGTRDGLPGELEPAALSVIEEAEGILAHRFDVLGSGPVELGAEIDWQCDFKSGYRWPMDFYLDLEVTRLDDASDAKVPWELSRSHQLLTLARAANLAADRRFVEELEAQLDSWIDANRPGFGINWVTPMEVAIRAINWAWAIGTVEPRFQLDARVRARVAQSLQVHARHIANNLEGDPLLRGNHYLADVVGLFSLSHFLPGDRSARRWERQARRALEREALRQVHDDGVYFEASLPYHGLALELFLIAFELASRVGRPLSRRYRDRLAAMLEVSRSLRQPTGRMPLFGDQDSGRILPAGFAREPTQDNLIDLGAAILGAPRLPSAPPDQEVAWTLGVPAWRKLAAATPPPTPARSSFPAGGLYLLTGDGVQLVARWGEVGQNGNGGHGHNDLSSYELSYGSSLVVDSGTFVYTADVKSRDEFRSATAHNVLVVDGRDMHSLPPGRPFEMPSHARFHVSVWDETDRRVVLVGEHDGYRRAQQMVTCRRQITMDRSTGVVEIEDEVEGHGQHTIESFVHLAPPCRLIGTKGACIEVQLESRRIQLSFDGADAVDVRRGYVSSQYGVRQSAPVIRAYAVRELPCRISYRIQPD